jgi:hypothetical protein
MLRPSQSLYREVLRRAEWLSIVIRIGFFAKCYGP